MSSLSDKSGLTTAVTSDGAEPSAKMRRRALVAGSVGTLIEFYDYGLYGAASGVVIGQLFFPTMGGTGGTLAAFATFAVGFFIRPIGGAIFANLGDKYGRKPVLTATVILMGCATVAMGLLPTFDQIGYWAAVLLVLTRMLQGAGAGAELASAMTLVAEYAPPRRRASMTAVPMGCAAAGFLTAILAFSAVSTLPEDALLSWGWRIPFLCSSVLFVVAFVIRRRIDETPEFVRLQERMLEQKTKQGVPLVTLVKTHPKELLAGALSNAAHNGNFYVLTTFSGSYMVAQLGMSKTAGLLAMASAAFAAFIGSPIMGLIADKIGARTMYRLSGLALVLFAFPLFLALQTKNLFLICVVMGVCGFVVYGGGAAGQGAYLANLFPANCRLSGVTLSREFNAMAVAGPTPFIASALVAAMSGAPWLVAGYLVVCGLVTFLAVSAVRDRYGNEHVGRETLQPSLPATSPNHVESPVRR